MILPSQGVMVVWDWKWLDNKINRISETSSEGMATINLAMGSCSDANQFGDECFLR